MKKIKLISAKKARKIEISQINEEILEAVSMHETEIIVPKISKKMAKKLKKKGFFLTYKFENDEFSTIISWEKKEKKKKGAICRNDFSDIEDYFLGLDDNNNDDSNNNK